MASRQGMARVSETSVIYAVLLYVVDRYHKQWRGTHIVTLIQTTRDDQAHSKHVMTHLQNYPLLIGGLRSRACDGDVCWSREPLQYVIGCVLIACPHTRSQDTQEHRCDTSKLLSMVTNHLRQRVIAVPTTLWKCLAGVAAL